MKHDMHALDQVRFFQQGLYQLPGNKMQKYSSTYFAGMNI